MHSIFKINEIKSPPILIRHLLPFSSIEGEAVDTAVGVVKRNRREVILRKP